MSDEAHFILSDDGSKAVCGCPAAADHADGDFGAPAPAKKAAKKS